MRYVVWAKNISPLRRSARHGRGVFANARRCVGEKYFAPTRLALYGCDVFAKAPRCVGEKYFAPTRLALHGRGVFAKAIRCVGEKYFAPRRLALHGCDVFAKAMHCRGEKFFALPPTRKYANHTVVFSFLARRQKIIHGPKTPRVHQIDDVAADHGHVGQAVQHAHMFGA